MRSRRVSIALAGVALASAACASLLGLDEITYHGDAGGVLRDVASDDSVPLDAAADGSDAGCDAATWCGCQQVAFCADFDRDAANYDFDGAVVNGGGLLGCSNAALSPPCALHASAQTSSSAKQAYVMDAVPCKDVETLELSVRIDGLAVADPNGLVKFAELDGFAGDGGLSWFLYLGFNQGGPHFNFGTSGGGNNIYLRPYPDAGPSGWQRITMSVTSAGSFELRVDGTTLRSGALPGLSPCAMLRFQLGARDVVEQASQFSASFDNVLVTTQ